MPGHDREPEGEVAAKLTTTSFPQLGNACSSVRSKPAALALILQAA